MADTGISRFSKVFWPIFASICAGAFALVKWYSDDRQQSHDSFTKEREQRYESFIKAIENATSKDSPVRRIAGVWQMNQFWSDQPFEETMAATLTGALVGVQGDDGLYRCAAAEVIGNAITGTDSYANGKNAERSRRIAHILYGDRSGNLGLVTELNRELAPAQQQSKPTTCEHSAAITALDATREAIRKNWEYLEGINLNTVDLRGSPLYESDLDSAMIRAADLRQTDLKCANLRGVDLTGSELDGANFFLANVADVTPESVRDKLLKEQKAITLTLEQWQQWRAADFRVSEQGKPVFNPEQYKPNDIWPCSP
jgi:hypothetical protein